MAPVFEDIQKKRANQLRFQQIMQYNKIPAILNRKKGADEKPHAGVVKQVMGRMTLHDENDAFLDSVEESQPCSTILTPREFQKTEQTGASTKLRYADTRINQTIVHETPRHQLKKMQLWRQKIKQEASDVTSSFKTVKREELPYLKYNLGGSNDNLHKYNPRYEYLAVAQPSITFGAVNKVIGKHDPRFEIVRSYQTVSMVKPKDYSHIRNQSMTQLPSKNMLTESSHLDCLKKDINSKIKNNIQERMKFAQQLVQAKAHAADLARGKTKHSRQISVNLESINIEIKQSSLENKGNKSQEKFRSAIKPHEVIESPESLKRAFKFFTKSRVRIKEVNQQTFQSTKESDFRIRKSFATSPIRLLKDQSQKGSFINSTFYQGESKKYRKTVIDHI